MQPFLLPNLHMVVHDLAELEIYYTVLKQDKDKQCCSPWHNIKLNKRNVGDKGAQALETNFMVFVGCAYHLV